MAEASTIISVATITIAVVVAVVQYAQWRTANQKVVVDLYDRRLKVFAKIEGAIGQVVREGNCDNTAFYEFSQGQADARFLFGNDVLDYLQELRKCLSFMVSFSDVVIDRSADREKLINKKSEMMTKFMNFYQESPALFGPYIGLTQKLTPFWRPW